MNNDPLSVKCPICDARPGEKCASPGLGRTDRSTHTERRVIARSSVRETRPYDVEPQPVPTLFQEPGPPSPFEQRGRVVHPLDEQTCTTGLAGVERARALLAQHRLHRPLRDEEPGA